MAREILGDTLFMVMAILLMIAVERWLRPKGNPWDRAPEKAATDLSQTIEERV